MGEIPDFGLAERMMDEDDEARSHWGFPLIIAPWSTRIPTAIEKAERLLDPVYDGNVWAANNGMSVITAGEVALAKTLWEMVESGDCGQFPPPPELIAFTEKIESL